MSEKVQKTKPSGIEWIGDIPADWEVNRLGYMFLFGKGLSITKEDLQDEGVSVVSYGEIHSKYGFSVNPNKNHLRCVNEKYLRTDRNSLLRHGDFVYADTSEDIEGSGNFTYLNSKTATFAGYHTIILKPVYDINHRYIAYLFDSIPFRTQIRSQVWGIKVYSITQGILKSAKILIPPPAEQQAIASFLDTQCEKIDGIITAMKQQIEVLKQYKTSLITETVTKGLDRSVPMKDSGIEWIEKIPAHWEVSKVKYLGDMKYGLGEPPTLDDDGIPIIRATNIRSGELFEEDLIYARRKDIPANKDVVLKKKDIIIVRSGAYAGDVAIIPEKWEGSIAGYDIIFTPNKIDSFFVLFTFLSDYILKYQLLLMRSRATQPHLNTQDIGNLVILIPPKNEQEKIAMFLSINCKKIDGLISDKQTSIATIKSYKKSLIYEYVTGKKRVKI
jgi:type I restriction enzyme S subunit